MQKTIKSFLLILALCFSLVASPIATDYAEATSVTDASVYWTTGYGSGGYCTLSANIYMIRRAMIARGSTKWANVTYSSAGPALCTSIPSMKWNYTYSCDGVTVKGTHLSMTGTPAQKAAQLRKLLDSHPEGVVVRGNRLAGNAHGALLTGYYGTGNNQFYVADSTHNASKFVKSPRGIETWASSTLNDMSNVQDAWYLTSISGIASSARNTYVVISGKAYYIDGNGKKVYGWYTISGNRCYFDPSDGHKLFGWQTIDGKRYYLDQRSGAAALNCKKTINGKTYIFDETGAVVTGWYTLGEDKYYCDENGSLSFGYCIVEGQPEYFNPETGVHMGSSADVKYIFDADRTSTSFKVADALKYELGKDKFDAVVVADGFNYPDALAGGYLAAEKDAPMLLVGKSSEKDVKAYIDKNLASNGTIYILGGTGAVSSAFENSVTSEGVTVKRLSGAERYSTNMAILEEADGATDELLVCSGTGYADSLAASAADKPILLVGASLTEVQKEYVAKFSKVYIVGGTGAVNATVESQIKAIVDQPVVVSAEEDEETDADLNGAGETPSNVVRFAGKTRYETSVAVAKQFMGSDAQNIVVVYGQNFPDGLSAGPLAAAMGSPIVLAAPNVTAAAAGLSKDTGINKLFVVGGPALLPIKTTSAIVS